MKNGILKKMAMAFGLVLISSSLSNGATAQGKVLRLEETVIQGRVQKPTAFFISSRQPFVYESIEIKESFVDEISKAVKKGPF